MGWHRQRRASVRADEHRRRSRPDWMPTARRPSARADHGVEFACGNPRQRALGGDVAARLRARSQPLASWGCRRHPDTKERWPSARNGGSAEMANRSKDASGQPEPRAAHAAQRHRRWSNMARPARRCRAGSKAWRRSSATLDPVASSRTCSTSPHRTGQAGLSSGRPRWCVSRPRRRRPSAARRGVRVQPILDSHATSSATRRCSSSGTALNAIKFTHGGKVQISLQRACSKWSGRHGKACPDFCLRFRPLSPGRRQDHAQGFGSDWARDRQACRVTRTVAARATEGRGHVTVRSTAPLRVRARPGQHAAPVRRRSNATASWATRARRG